MKLSSHQIVTFALSILDNGAAPVHTEEVALKAHEIAPDRFSWQRYRDKPDKELVRKALFHASEQKNGALVTGRSGKTQGNKSFDGWQLTPAGIQWVHSNRTQLESLFGRSAPALNKEDAQRFLSKLQRHSSYETFLQTGNVTQATRYDLADLVQSAPDSSPDLIRSKLSGLERRAQMAGDITVVEFIKAWQRHATELLGVTADGENRTDA